MKINYSSFFTILVLISINSLYQNLYNNFHGIGVKAEKIENNKIKGSEAFSIKEDQFKLVDSSIKKSSNNDKIQVKTIKSSFSLNNNDSSDGGINTSTLTTDSSLVNLNSNNSFNSDISFNNENETNSSLNKNNNKNNNIKNDNNINNDEIINKDQYDNKVIKLKNNNINSNNKTKNNFTVDTSSSLKNTNTNDNDGIDKNDNENSYIKSYTVFNNSKNNKKKIVFHDKFYGRSNYSSNQDTTSEYLKNKAKINKKKLVYKKHINAIKLLQSPDAAKINSDFNNNTNDNDKNKVLGLDNTSNLKTNKIKTSFLQENSDKTIEGIYSSNNKKANDNDFIENKNISIINTDTADTTYTTNTNNSSYSMFYYLDEENSSYFGIIYDSLIDYIFTTNYYKQALYTKMIILVNNDSSDNNENDNHIPNENNKLGFFGQSHDEDTLGQRLLSQNFIEIKSNTIQLDNNNKSNDDRNTSSNGDDNDNNRTKENDTNNLTSSTQPLTSNFISTYKKEISLNKKLLNIILTSFEVLIKNILKENIIFRIQTRSVYSGYDMKIQDLSFDEFTESKQYIIWEQNLLVKINEIDSDSEIEKGYIRYQIKPLFKYIINSNL